MDAAPDWSTDSHIAAEREIVGTGSADGALAAQIQAVAGCFLWCRFSTLCAVGGGDGTSLAALMQRHSHVWGSVLDRAEHGPPARHRFNALGLGLRASFIAGDPARAVPPGFDAYFLNWAGCGRIDRELGALLRAVRAAIAPRSRLVLALSEGTEAIACPAVALSQDLAEAGFAIERGIPVGAATCLLLARPAGNSI